MKHMLPPYHPSDDECSSFSQLDTGGTFTRSLSALNTSPLAPNEQRRSSFDSKESSIPPELFSASSVGTMSPSTPLNGFSFDSSCMDFRITAPPTNLQEMWALQQNEVAEHEIVFSPMTRKERDAPRPFNTYSTVHTTHTGDYLSPSLYSLPFRDALSQPMFTDVISLSAPISMSNNGHWSDLTVAHSPPPTINPATFASFSSRSPSVKEDPCTPLRQHHRSSLILCSSPLSGYSPGMVPSQHEADDVAFFGISNMKQDIVEATYVVMDSEMRHSRLARRRYNHKRSGSSSRRRPLANKSGIDCEAFIPQNSFACSYPDCIDKSTGKQKKFKRQEHKKRHEKTVHEKENHLSHTCWVPKCGRPFSRTDNLKSHLKNTHGKRSANARNRYVATLDPNNPEYYEPEWIGDLTLDGLPIHRCNS